MKPHRFLHAVDRSSRCGGQATVEFLVALLVMVPMFFGVFYFARYSDVKHSAIQASRYVAFERTLDPNYRAKTRVQLAEETRARFFTPVSRNSSGEITYHQTTAGISADTGRTPLWSDAEYQPMLRRFADVQVSEVNAGALSSGATVGALHTTVGKTFGLPAGGVVRGEVTVPLANVAHFDVLNGINIGLPGATAIGSGGWNASGTKSGTDTVCSRVLPAVPSSYLSSFMDPLGWVMGLFESNTPDIGRVLPDYVPPGSVRNGNANVAYPAQNGNQC